MNWGLPWPGAELAATAEAAGAEAFCAGEFADLNAYATATEMALDTSTAMVGSGIAYAFEDEVAAIRAAFRSARPDSIADHVTDEMLWAIAICGDTTQAREMLTARTRLPQLAFVSPPSFLVGRKRHARYDAAAIALMSEPH